MEDAGEPSQARSYVDLHCHSNASFDSLASPRSLMRAALARGLTHLAITDHNRIDGALRARDLAPDGLKVIVGEEVRTADGDLICLFLERPLPPGRPAAETIAVAREQGGLVGIPHPFDRFRGSLLRDRRRADLAGLTGLVDLDGLASSVDWIEGHNARIVGGHGNESAMLFARERGLPVVAVSDAHSTIEVGVAYTILRGDISTPAALLAALPGAELVTGRASYLVRGITPLAKAVQRARGRGRVAPGDAP